MELMVNVGLMHSVSATWPELVQEAWTDRIEGMIHWMRTQVDEVQEFASSYD